MNEINELSTTGTNATVEGEVQGQVSAEIRGDSQNVHSNGNSNQQNNGEQESSQTQNGPSQEEKESVLNGYVARSLEEKHLAFNAYLIKRLYPKAYENLRAWMTEKSKYMVNDDTMIGTMVYAPRSIVYEFFDEHDFVLNVLGYGASWNYAINGGQLFPESSRLNAEYEGFMEAFRRLEVKLK